VQIIDTETGWIETQIGFISGDRRAKVRYELHLPLQYGICTPNGTVEGLGTTRNLSSNGVAFETADELAPGTPIELAIQWPVRLENGVPLKLVATGTVAWCAGGVAALNIKRCQFRTQRRAAASGGFVLP
jgi:hypothetical protein